MDAILDGLERREQREAGHKIWPWNARLMLCPLDGQWHDFGCECARRDPEIVPGSVRAWYVENWGQPAAPEQRNQPPAGS